MSDNPITPQGDSIAKVTRGIAHYLDRLEARSNGSTYPASNPSNKTSGYLVAEVPDWALRQWLHALEALPPAPGEAV